MLRRMMKKLESLPPTIVAGVFLLLSLLLPRTGLAQAASLAWVTVVICGLPLVFLALDRLFFSHGLSRISSALLISTGMIASVLIGDLFAAGEIAFIMAIGELLEDMTAGRAKKGLKQLVSLAPQTARLLTEKGEEIVDATDVRAGDLLRVLPGERIPADGVIESGNTCIDQSVMTGESLPVDKTKGDDVFCGTLNRDGAIDIRAVRVGADSSLQTLIRMVREAEEKKAPTQRIADKWASLLVPLSLTIALVTWLVTGDITRAVTVVVVFCPCALVLATPTAIMAAIGQAAKNGVIIKSGEALEKMGRVYAVAFDKTGTLTSGSLHVSDIVTTGTMSREELLLYAASAEAKSEHPLGRAIVDYAKEKGLPLKESEDFRMSAGRGVTAVFDGAPWVLGTERMLSENGIPVCGQAGTAAQKLRADGKALVFVAGADAVEGIIALSDTVRPEARAMVGSLCAMHVTPVLLTGDHESAARYLAAQTGLREIRASLLPEDKVRELYALKEKGSVCMIGDGVNDAPALKSADVGVAMGVQGSDIAVDAADIALMTDDLSRIPYLKWLSNTTLKTIRLAITLSMSINLVAVFLSVTGLLTPTTGALLHNAGSCFVVLLAALLYDRKYRPDGASFSLLRRRRAGTVLEKPDCEGCGRCMHLPHAS
ncbi:MAG: cation-translocating P-type ATPase [Lachnospiraceae bacterium]|nr:cation-translocating P-type ATPase [Lachnospiraceae bacterium]